MRGPRKIAVTISEAEAGIVPESRSCWPSRQRCEARMRVSSRSGAATVSSAEHLVRVVETRWWE